jgi:peptidoglycan L-alanyl-D-glutamate endopeptidase CwlK
MTTDFTLGTSSLQHLEGVHPKLMRVVMRAIQLTTQDFGVHEGVRTEATQLEYFRRGVTKTLKSQHLLQPDGFGHAVDLVPYVNGVLRWEWALIYPIASAMRTAAIECDTSIRWGAVWDKSLNYLLSGLQHEVLVYSQRHPGPDFLDGPHYELD